MSTPPDQTKAASAAGRNSVGARYVASLDGPSRYALEQGRLADSLTKKIKAITDGPASRGVLGKSLADQIKPGIASTVLASKFAVRDDLATKIGKGVLGESSKNITLLAQTAVAKQVVTPDVTGITAGALKPYLDKSSATGSILGIRSDAIAAGVFARSGLTSAAFTKSMFPPGFIEEVTGLKAMRETLKAAMPDTSALAKFATLKVAEHSIMGERLAALTAASVVNRPTFASQVFASSPALKALAESQDSTLSALMGNATWKADLFKQAARIDRQREAIDRWATPVARDLESTMADVAVATEPVVEDLGAKIVRLENGITEMVNIYRVSEQRHDEERTLLLDGLARVEATQTRQNRSSRRNSNYGALFIGVGLGSAFVVYPTAHGWVKVASAAAVPLMLLMFVLFTRDKD